MRPCFRLLLPAFALMGAGCHQDYSFTEYVAPYLGVEARMIYLEPAIIDFGHVEPGETGVQSISIENRGDAPLFIKEIAVQGFASFTADTPSAERLDPGESASMTLRYSPLAFERGTASLQVFSSDPILPKISASLAGRASSPSITITPPHFDFGQEFLGCPLTHAIEIGNEGEGRLEVLGLTLADGSDEFSLQLPDGAPPYFLETGETLPIGIGYTPEDAGSDEITLLVSSNDPERPEVEAITYGTGRVEGHITDLFDQLANNQTDILFVVDNSHSMTEEQDTLACNFNSFLEIVDTLEIDYNIGVITTDTPVLQGEDKIITPESLTPNQTFSENVHVGVEGFGYEAGLEMTRLALSEPLISNQNEGFLRPQAGLRLIYISDENDHSGDSVEAYIEFLQGLKANPRTVISSAIIGDPQTGCGSSAISQPAPLPSSLQPSAASCPEQACGKASAGDRYLETVVATEGVFASICSCNFIEALEQVAFETVHLVDTFPLTQDPRPESIVVYVNDEEADGWVWVESQNAIFFVLPIDVPPNGSRIRVEYDLRAYCED